MVKLTNRASIAAVIEQMSLEEKARLVTGYTAFSTYAIPRLGIPSITMVDGGTGVNFVQYFNDLLTRMRVRNDPTLMTCMFGAVSSGTIKRILRKVNRGEELNEEEQQIYDTAKSQLDAATDERGLPGCFPPGNMLGATWDRETVRLCGSAVGREMDAYHIDLVLGTPNINMLRDPCNGRVFEGYSEDPCLNATLAPEFVRGVQEEGPVANVKHFAVNNQETRRHTLNVHVGERAMEEIYFPGFRACVQEGQVKSVMSAYNKINGTSCAMNHWLLSDVLRGQWNFDGLVLSDWGAAYDQVEALKAGNDLDMPGPRDIQPILDAVEDGRLTQQELDTNVERILRVILETPAMKGRKHFTVDRAYSEQIAHRCAAEGAVLLKNTGVLPLTKTMHLSIYGNAAKRFNEAGSGSTEVFTDRWTSLLETARQMVGEEHISFEKMSEQTDAVVAVVVADGQEGTDRPMDLNADDKNMLLDVIAQAKALSKPVIVVLNVAGAVDMREYLDDVDAVLCVWFPGMEGGRVTAEILYGDINPSGKLPLTFPKKYQDCPSFGNFPGCAGEVFYGEGILVGYRYYDTKGVSPAFAFGHGLSYTQFTIDNLQLSQPVMDLDAGETVTATVRVKNVGKRPGKEVVQLYIHDVKSTLDKPAKELKAFEKIELQPGETKAVSFEITKKMLESYDPEYHCWSCEAGRYELLVGNASDNISCQDSVLVKCTSIYNYGPKTCLYDLYCDARTRVLLEQLIADLQLDLSVLEDELYYRKFRPIDTILHNLPNVKVTNREALIQAFYKKIYPIDLSVLEA